MKINVIIGIILLIIGILLVAYPSNDGIDFLSGFFFGISIIVLFSGFKKIKSKSFFLK